MSQPVPVSAEDDIKAGLADEDMGPESSYTDILRLKSKLITATERRRLREAAEFIAGGAWEVVFFEELGKIMAHHPECSRDIAEFAPMIRELTGAVVQKLQLGKGPK